MITHLNEKLIDVEVPSDSFDIFLKNNMSETESIYLRFSKIKDTHEIFPITEPGLFKILGEVDADNISQSIINHHYQTINSKYREAFLSKTIQLIKKRF